MELCVQILRQHCTSGSVDRKLDLLVGELGRYKMADWSEMCSNSIDVLVQKRRVLTCAANVFSGLGTYHCVCGFRRKNGLTRHRNFCGPSNLSLVWEDFYKTLLSWFTTVDSYQVPSVYVVY